MLEHDERIGCLKEFPVVNGGAIDLSKFVKLPGGGTHDIYKLKENPTYLLKVVKESIGKDHYSLETILTTLIAKYNQLYQVFGDDKCLVESRCIHPIQQSESDLPKEAIISLVRYDSCFNSNEKFGFHTDTVEIQECKIQNNKLAYHAMNSFLLGYKKSNAVFDSDSFLKFHESFRPIFQLLDKSLSLREAMKDFLEKFKKYYHQTNQFMDFTGYNNVLFFKEGEIWRYKVGSVIKVETKDKINKLLSEIDTDPAVVNEPGNWTHVFFVPSWMRILNATAEKLEMDRIVDDIILTEKDSENLARIHKTQPFNLRAVALAEEKNFEKALDFFQKFCKTETIHDSRTREMLGTLYWRFLQERQGSRPREEIEKFLSLLTDHKNDFSDKKKEEAKAAIERMQAILNC